jgi:SpoVK/Ycf46/Vps4 family AAA+-type ATPase
MTGRSQDVQAYIRRIARRVQSQNASLAQKLGELATQAPSQDSPLRDASMSMVPVDADSRLRLLRHEYPVHPEREMVFRPDIKAMLDQVLAERRRAADLAKLGIAPTRSLLMSGPPGVGKTMTARWLAAELGKPLLTLDLSAVMSSFLGRTGGNLRSVLDYAKGTDCVLLLDEFDAIAKRRDDGSEVGELKRLVTVLLQEVDDWPATGLLIAATNHGELLDPAAWRRFDHVLTYPLPTIKEHRAFVQQAVAEWGEVPPHLTEATALMLQGASFSDAARLLNQARRWAFISDEPAAAALEHAIQQLMNEKPLAARKAAALALRRASVSDRQIQRLTGVARDTLRIMKKPEIKSGKCGTAKVEG